ncbi:MAG: Zinc uptake regulation protein ZUR [uncultured bacterium]|nr:MAG: Zinc uptake regulation protein ZUR [uncultured bacterium]
MSKTEIVSRLLMDSDLTITPLRKDVLDIFLSSQKPLSAYEVLDKLKKKRFNAKPPTVYRVIDYFVEKNIIHRIETGSKYVCCAQLSNFKSNYHGILFLCKKCKHSFEFMDEEFLHFLKKFSKKQHLSINETLIEIKGVCQNCR